jgi:hypothetical protein
MKNTDAKQITVKELIHLLQKAIEKEECLPTSLVWCDGCDCTGEAGGIRCGDGVEIIRTEHVGDLI